MEVNSDYLKNLISSATFETVESIAEILCIELEQDKEPDIIPKINNVLNNSKTRLVGLQLLYRLLPHVSNEGLNGNYSKWLNVCVNQGNDPQQVTTLKILTKLLDIGKNNDTFIKKFSSDFLSTTIQICLNLKNLDRKEALECLIQCLNIFPSALGNQKVKIETFLLDCLENLGERDAKVAGVAFHFLQQAGPGGVNGINYVNNYFTQLKKLCATLHLLYDQFFESYEEVYVYQEVSEDSCTLKPILNNLDYLDILSRRIINCTSFTKMMLCTRYPVEKRIIPKNIIDIVCRGLSLHICLSQEHITKKARFQSLLLNKIQLHLLKLLQTFISCIFVGTIPFSHVIINTLANCIRRTSDCKCFTHNLSFKNNIYRTLNKWLLLSKNVSQSTFVDVVLPSLLKDCLIFEKSSVILKSRTKTDKTKIIKTEPSNIQALELLKTILNSWTNKLQTKEVLKLTINSIVEANRSRKSNCSTVFQLKLYELLEEFSRSSDFPVNVIAQLFSDGHQSPQFSIRTAANHGLQLTQQICNPVCYSLSIGEKIDISKDCDKIQLNQPFSTVITTIDQNNDEIVTPEQSGTITAERLEIATTNTVDDKEEFSREKDTGNFGNNNKRNTDILEHNMPKNNNTQTAMSPHGDLSEEPLTKKIRFEETEMDKFSSFQDLPQEETEKDMFSSFQDLPQE